jgi:hypothetical protein
MDIVDRLRSPEVFLTDGLISPVAETAAQEIERLREALHKIAHADAYDENGKPNGGGYFINLARATLGEKE